MWYCGNQNQFIKRNQIIKSKLQMRILEFYKIENGDASQVVIICASSEAKAIELLKDADCETFTSYDDYRLENPSEFENEEEFEDWNFAAFYEKFPRNSLSIKKLERKEEIIGSFSCLE